MRFEVLTIALALIVAVITFGQWQTSRESQKLALFEMRYAVYEKVTAFLAKILTEGSIENNAELDFLRDTKNAYFLFSADTQVVGLIDDIYSKAVELHLLQSTHDSILAEERHKNVEKQLTVKTWMQQTLNDMQKCFEGHLLLKH